MAIEIERRFLVNGEDWKSFAKSKKEFKQGYISTNPNNWTVRVRIENEEKGFLTLKMPLTGISNHEFEYEIPLSEAELILDLSENKLQKTRYELNWNNKSWIIDYFKGENHSLVIAEIELISEQEVLIKPNWCGEEITGLYQWSNAYLSKLPISKCSINTRLKSKK